MNDIKESLRSTSYEQRMFCVCSSMRTMGRVINSLQFLMPNSAGYNTGINLSSVLMSNDSDGRVIYLDKLGNVSTSADNLASNGFSEDEMNGNWLFILQRNFSTTNNLLLVTQGCYYIQLPPPLPASSRER